MASFPSKIALKYFKRVREIRDNTLNNSSQLDHRKVIVVSTVNNGSFRSRNNNSCKLSFLIGMP